MTYISYKDEFTSIASQGLHKPYDHAHPIKPVCHQRISDTHSLARKISVLPTYTP